MSSGFSNPLVGGGGALVYPSIHSPDYVAGVSGWSINKSGTAQLSGLIFLGDYISQFISANGQTFNTTALVVRTGGGGASYTGLIMAKGTAAAQQCQLINTDSVSNLTMAAAITSNVAGGTANVITPLSGANFTWIPQSQLWYAL